eukprot:COSAG02_NODE_3005_length_7570_cov_3.554812_8_plen_153_part_00
MERHVVDRTLDVAHRRNTALAHVALQPAAACAVHRRRLHIDVLVVARSELDGEVRVNAISGPKTNRRVVLGRGLVEALVCGAALERHGANHVEQCRDIIAPQALGVERLELCHHICAHQLRHKRLAVVVVVHEDDLRTRDGGGVGGVRGARK